MTEVEKFVERTNNQIQNEGLLGISAVRFDRGGTPMDVLQSKIIEYDMYNRPPVGPMKLPTLEEMAKSFNEIEAAINRGDCETMVFDDGTRLESNLTREVLDKFNLEL